MFSRFIRGIRVRFNPSITPASGLKMSVSFSYAFSGSFSVFPQQFPSLVGIKPNHSYGILSPGLPRGDAYGKSRGYVLLTPLGFS